MSPGARAARSDYLYVRDFLGADDRAELLAWLATLHPIWELRYSTRRPLPPGREQRRLLRPVYWLGTWQFACLGYYSPPRGTRDRVVAAEPYPPVLARLVADIETRVRATVPRADIPPGWRLDTCLVNFYGTRLEDGKWIDAARVGEHRDFEPGPVASLSIGERALFQFVSSPGQGAPSRLERTQWLDDGSLQAFAGARWKDRMLHRVQRVDHKQKLELPPAIEGFRTRRVNFTFRHVPSEHVVPLARLGTPAREDVQPYIEELAKHAAFWRSVVGSKS